MSLTTYISIKIAIALNLVGRGDLSTKKNGPESLKTPARLCRLRLR